MKLITILEKFMIHRLCFLFLFLATTLTSKEIEIPDDLTPIDGVSTIEYSYELDEDPYFIERLNDDKFLVMTLDGNDIELHEYSLSKDTIILKLEFEYDDDESLENFLIKDNKLTLFFVYGTLEGVLGIGSTGFFERIVTIDLKSYIVEDCKFVFTNYNRDIIEDYEMKNDWDFCGDNISDDAFAIDFEKQGVMPIRYRSMLVTFNKDSTEKNYFGVTYNDETRETYLFSGNLDLRTFKTTSSLNRLNDGKTWIFINYIYLDDESNVYFIGNQSDKEKQTRSIVSGKITPDGILTNKIQDISYTVKENWNNLNSFSEFKIKDKKISLFGYSKHDDGDDFYEEPNSAIILLEFDINTLEIKYKEKSISIDEGLELNSDDENFRFNSINKIIETKEGYTLLTETNENTWTSTKDQYGGRTYTFYAYSENINLISLDKDLNIKWNNHIYRDFSDYSLKMGPHKGKFNDQHTANSTYLKPEVSGDEITFTYSTDEPEDEIIRISYNINTGEQIRKQPIFENDGTMSYFPGNHFKVGEDEYVGLLSEDDYYIVRYKLLK